MFKFRKALLYTLLTWTAFTQVGCFGKFALTRMIYEWNDSLGNNFLKSLVMWVLIIIPVYAIAGFVDIVLLNLIEFWSGSNPLAMKEGEVEKQLLTKCGVTYELTATKNSFHVKQLDGIEAGREVSLLYSPENGKWTCKSGDAVAGTFALSMRGSAVEGATVSLADGTVKQLGEQDLQVAFASR
jgi:hypothetical protein